MPGEKDKKVEKGEEGGVGSGEGKKTGVDSMNVNSGKNVGKKGGSQQSTKLGQIQSGPVLRSKTLKKMTVRPRHFTETRPY